MTTGINLWDSGVWSFVVTLSLLFTAMIVANTLQNLFPALRKALIPGSVLGGFLLLGLNGLCKELFAFSLYSTETLEILTYHGLGLGFAALALRRHEKQKDGRTKSAAFDAGVTVVNGYLLQAVLGLLVTLSLYNAMGSFFASGLLLPMGYGQGPGQAYSWGHNYEVTWGFQDGTSFGLAVAAMGFVSASIGGVIYLNWLRKKGIFHGTLGADVKEDLTLSTFTGHNEVPLSESLDKFTIQLALVFLSYALAYLFMAGVNTLLDPAGTGAKGLAGTIQGMIWGFQFLFGSVFAMLVKAVMGVLKKKGIMTREYTNNFLQNRIAGFMFDLMVVASIAAIDLRAFREAEFVLPLTMICLLGAVGTFLYLKYICKRVFPWYEHEAFLSLYGMQTGTASTGVILLRELDPRFETQASDNLVYHMPWAILFGAPMFLMVGIAPQDPGRAWVVLLLCAGLFVVFNIILLRKSLFRKDKS
ncbi:MAG: hypothetical protein IKQ69_02925 [Oscillospiraceae bacterium]|nr:hypothetical protein [Oscillospiraceae bacterium]